MTSLTEARAEVRRIRRLAREAKSERRDGELAVFEAYDCASVKPPPRTLNPKTGRARRDYSGGEWDWYRARPFWQQKLLIGGPSAVYSPDELLDVLYEAGVLSSADDMDTWANRVLSARQSASLSPEEVGRLSGHPADIVARVLTGDIEEAAEIFRAWSEEMGGSLREQYDALRALQAHVAAEVERFAGRVRHERYDAGRSWASIGHELELSRSRVLRIAHPQGGQGRDDCERRPTAGTEVRDEHPADAGVF